MLRRYTPHLLLVACNLLWALDYPLYHILLSGYLRPMGLLTLTLMATALFSLLPLLRGPFRRVERRDIPLLVVGALLLGLLHKGFMMKALSITSPIDGSIINTLGPLIVLLLSVAAKRDRFTPLKLAGLLIGLAGAVGVILWGGSAAHQKSDLWGNLMMVVAVLATACYTVWLKGALERYTVTTVLMWVYSIAALLSFPLGFISLAKTDFGAWDLKGWLSLGGVLLLLTYLPNYLYNKALRRSRPLQTSIFSYLQPVAAILLSVLLRLDHLKWDTILCALVIFVGIALVLIDYNKKSLPQNPTKSSGEE